MVQRGSENNGIPDRTRQENDHHGNGPTFDAPTPASGSFPPGSSIGGQLNTAEPQKRRRRTRFKKGRVVDFPNSNELQYEQYDISQHDLSQFEPQHREYAARYYQQQAHQQHMLQQSRQQVHQGAFHPTAANFDNQQLPRNPPLTAQGFDPTQPPTPPPTNPPSDSNSNSKPPTGPKRRHSGIKRQFRGDDPIITPSLASGGVPDPTPAYLLRASFIPRHLAQPQPLLVIIDLNGTLVHRPSRTNPRHIVPRPHACEFLRYCIDTFHVMIWSSARPQNVAAMCEKLLTPDQRSRVVAVWGRDTFGLTPEDYSSRVQCYKRLTKVWADPTVQATYPADYDDAGIRRDLSSSPEEQYWKPGSWNQGSTVLIDDSKEKARSEPHNAVEIHEFSGDPRDDVLPRVHDYLNELACQADVSTYIRVNPFRAPEKEMK